MVHQLLYVTLLGPLSFTFPSLLNAPAIDSLSSVYIFVNSDPTW